MDGMKQWKCRNGHVLGVIERVRVEGHHVARLRLYRVALDYENGSMGEVDVMAVVEGTVLDVRCSICDAVRQWYMGRDALERAVRSYLAE